MHTVPSSRTSQHCTSSTNAPSLCVCVCECAHFVRFDSIVFVFVCATKLARSSHPLLFSSNNYHEIRMSTMCVVYYLRRQHHHQQQQLNFPGKLTFSGGSFINTTAVDDLLWQHFPPPPPSIWPSSSSSLARQHCRHPSI